MRILDKEVSVEEIKNVLFAMAANKSPGPDGFTCEFYKSTWSVIGNDFVVAVQSFFRFPSERHKLYHLSSYTKER